MRTDAYSRLRNLPDIFTSTGFCRLTGISENAARVYLHRWKSKGLIESAGDRVAIYFNKVTCVQIDSTHRIEALLSVYPSAILCGESVLHASGWITQIPSQIFVTVKSRASYVSLYGFVIHGRPLSWLKKVQPIILAGGEDTRLYGMRSLPPALALADMYGDPKAWHPDPDDLDIPDDDIQKVRDAFNLLEVECPESLAAIIYANSPRPPL